MGWAADGAERRRVRPVLVLPALVLSVVAGLLPALTPRVDAAEPAPGGTPVVVIGDSISSVGAWDRYRRGASGETSSRPVVWWGRLAELAGLDPQAVLPLTEGGSGYLHPGAGTTADGRPLCHGTTFGQRLEAVSAARPQVLVVAGGRNDTASCSGTVRTAASPDQQRRAIRAFYAELATLADEIGLPRTQVYVLVPWGTSEVFSRTRLEREIEAAARMHGLTFVPVPNLGRTELLDTTHPNDAGGRRLAQAVAEGSAITSALTGLATTPRPATRPVSVRASTACSVAEQADARPVTWGRAGAAGLVNAELARADRTPLRIAPGSWLDQALPAGASIVAAPAVGDVAWWPSGPRAGLGSGEHVAVVRGLGRGGLDVHVVESGPTRVCRRTTYGPAALPRAYVRMRATTGTPLGLVTGVRAGRRSVRVTGWAYDPDAATGRTGVRVTVRTGSKVLARRAVAGQYERFSVTATVPARTARGLRPGRKVQVVVEAINAPGTQGSGSVRLGTRTTRLAR